MEGDPVEQDDTLGDTVTSAEAEEEEVAEEEAVVLEDTVPVEEALEVLEEEEEVVAEAEAVEEAVEDTETVEDVDTDMEPVFRALAELVVVALLLAVLEPEAEGEAVALPLEEVLGLADAEFDVALTALNMTAQEAPPPQGVSQRTLKK